MTNAEKYLKDGTDIQEFVKEFIHYYHTNIYTLDDSLSKFFKVKIKPTLTEDERVILRNIDKKHFQTIYRTQGELMLAGEDENAYKRSEFYKDFGLFNHLFQFIKERRRI